MQQVGVDAAIASLWQVSDGGTQSLMDAFYAALVTSVVRYAKSRVAGSRRR
ncbi:MAG: CHAT domain-containing protein [Synechococcales cyanobacterium RM1_1_8]|nr:CHAT domain-containing protein [Synechococcales cyanobacterium RM1_1_8]